MLHCFIINPQARRGSASQLIRSLEEALRAHRMDYRIVASEKGGQATELARDAVAQGAEAVVAVGGDGTVNEVLNGLGAETRFGILPVGTCNDIASNLGLPVKDWRAALDIIAAGHTMQADVGRCGERRFLSVAAIGLDSEVGMAFRRLPRLLRCRAAYTLLLFLKLMTQRPSMFRLTLNGKTIERNVWLVAVANTACYGGGMRIAPRARPDDGRLHVCIVGDGPRREIIRSFPLVYRGEHVTHPMVRMFETREIHISSSMATPIIADGEHFGWLPASLAVEPQALAVFAPRVTRP